MRRLLPFGDWPVRWKVVLLLAGASTLPLAVSTFIEFRSQRGKLTAGAIELLSARADQSAGELDAFHRGYQRSAGRLAKLPQILRYAQAPPDRREGSSPHARAILDVWKDSDPAFRGIGLLDSHGTVILATERPLLGRDLAFHDYVRRALGGMPVISDLHFAGPEVGSIPTIAYLAPITTPDGKAAGAVALWVKATALWELLAAWNEKAGAGSFSVLYDLHGVRIAHSYSRDVLFTPGGALDPGLISAFAGENRFGKKTRELLEAPRRIPEHFDIARSPGPPGQAFIRGFAPVNQQWNYGVPRRLKTVPWTLFYMLPERSLLAPIVALSRRMAILSALIIALAFGAGMLIAGGIIARIRDISLATEAMSRGRLDARVKARSGDEIGRLGSDFNTMAERLEAMIASERAANKELESFSYSVAHDLRAPLRHVNGYVEMLQEKEASRLKGESLRYLSSIADSAKKMGTLIDELLSFSRMGRVEMRKAQVDLDHLVRAVIADLHQDVSGRTIRWEIGKLPEVKGDEAMLRLALANLIANAVKFTGARAETVIEVGSAYDQPQEVVIFVRDNGAGFDMEYSDKLFGIFQRLHRTDEFEGTGIGLANVRRIVHRHGGRTWARGAVGKGAAFYFSLPHSDGKETS